MDHQDRPFEERAPGLFEPDTLLPTQYFDRLRRKVAPDGERRLMVAVLEDAVSMYLKHAGAADAQHRALFLDADEWIENRDSRWFYSFENVCDVLDLEPEYLRRGLHAWKARARRTPEPAEVQIDSGPDALRRASGE